MQHYYFDHNATTPIAPAVLDDMRSTLGEVYGNASSIHYFGQAAKERLEQARRRVGDLLGASSKDVRKEIVFTSGGTEADNLAILGSLRASNRPTRHVITSAIEHPAVLNTCAHLEREGVAVDYLPVDASGVVNPDDVRGALRPDTGLITIMHVNNELGTIQPLAEIAAIAREAGVLFHSDGVQAAGRIPIQVDPLGVDLYSISAHKFYGPKGAGALYARKGTVLRPILYGGHHERDRRAGTENVPVLSAMGVAAATVPSTDLRPLRDRLERGILDRVPDARVNCATSPRIPNTSNITFDYIEGEPLVIALDLRGFAISSGSACSSGAVEPSHVLRAIGLSDTQARSSIRISLGAANTAEQVDALVDAIADSVAHLRRISPQGVVHA
ncbi:MAG TPA: cysteine desulfurase family protein [Bryobacteraceae bacterium]|jgi:cysteine desulfurase